MPLLLAVALLLVGCIAGAGVVAVGAVVAHFGDHRVHNMRDGRGPDGWRGYGPGQGQGPRRFPQGPGRVNPGNPGPGPTSTPSPAPTTS